MARDNLPRLPSIVTAAMTECASSSVRSGVSIAANGLAPLAIDEGA